MARRWTPAEGCEVDDVAHRHKAAAVVVTFGFDRERVRDPEALQRSGDGVFRQAGALGECSHGGAADRLAG